MNLLRGAFLSRMLCSAALKEFRGATEERIERRRTRRCLILELDGTHTVRHSSALFRLFRVKSQSIFLLTILTRPLKRKVGVPKFNLYNFQITFAFCADKSKSRGLCLIVHKALQLVQKKKKNFHPCYLSIRTWTPVRLPTPKKSTIMCIEIYA